MPVEPFAHHAAAIGRIDFSWSEFRVEWAKLKKNGGCVFALLSKEESAMFANRHVALQLTALLLPALIYTTAVAALDDRTSGTADRPATPSKMPQAPVGHRQPTAADVAKEQPTMSDEEREKRDRALDKRLQICRGC